MRESITVATRPRCYKVTAYSAEIAADSGFDLEGFLRETSERHLRELCARRGRLVPTNITERFRGTWAEAEAAVAAGASAEPDGRVCWAMAVLTDCAGMPEDGLLFAVHTADGAAGGRD